LASLLQAWVSSQHSGPVGLYYLIAFWLSSGLSYWNSNSRLLYQLNPSFSACFQFYWAFFVAPCWSLGLSCLLDIWVVDALRELYRIRRRFWFGADLPWRSMIALFLWLNFRLLKAGLTSFIFNRFPEIKILVQAWIRHPFVKAVIIDVVFFYMIWVLIDFLQ
jgi:hypothetical protein